MRCFPVAVHEGPQLFHRAVFAADLADLPADGDRDSRRFQIPDHRREFGGKAVVEPLLLQYRRLLQIDERRGVDVDVVKSGVDRLPDQVLDGLDLGLRIGCIFLRPHLEVVALEEERSPVSCFESRRGHGAGVLLRPLARVIDLRAGDLKDHRPDAGCQRGPEDRLGGVVGERADVDRRHGKTGNLPPPHRLVKPLNRRHIDARRRGGPPDQPAGGLPRLRIRREDRRLDQIIDQLSAELLFIQDLDIALPLTARMPAGPFSAHPVFS